MPKGTRQGGLELLPVRTNDVISNGYVCNWLKYLKDKKAGRKAKLLECRCPECRKK